MLFMNKHHSVIFILLHICLKYACFGDLLGERTLVMLIIKSMRLTDLHFWDIWFPMLRFTVLHIPPHIVKHSQKDAISIRLCASKDSRPHYYTFRSFFRPHSNSYKLRYTIRKHHNPPPPCVFTVDVNDVKAFKKAPFSLFTHRHDSTPF